MKKIRYIGDWSSRRLRVRRVYEEYEAHSCASEAIENGQWVVLGADGGAVANAYRYPAATEAALIIAAPDGRVVVYRGARVPANKVTPAGVAKAYGSVDAAVLLDRRYGKSRKAAALAALKEQFAGIYAGAEEEES